MVIKVGEFDITPEIHYSNGRVVRITTYYLMNNKQRMLDHMLNSNGSFSQRYYGPGKDGQWSLSVSPISREELARFDLMDPQGHPFLLFLGKELEMVREALCRSRRDVKYLAA